MSECQTFSSETAAAWAVRHGIDKDHLFEFLTLEGVKFKEEVEKNDRNQGSPD